jgi:thymidine phosphorylase
MDMGAGVDLFRKLGDTVEKGEALYRIHAEFPADYEFAQRLADKDIGYQIH